MLKLSLGALAATQLLTQLVMQIVVLRSVGAGMQTDAYVAAMTVPLLLFSILGVSLQNVWQPRLSVLASDVVQWRAAQAVAQGQVLVSFGACVLVLFASAELWVALLFPGFERQQVQLTSFMTRIMLVGATFNGQSALFTTAQRARERFAAAEFVPIVGSLAAIVAVLLTVQEYGIVAVAWISLLRSALVCAVLFWLAERPPVTIAGAWRSQTWSQLYPVLAGSSLYKTSPLIDRFWASQAGSGAITIYNLVQMGMGAIAAVLERAFSTSMVPGLARRGGIRDLLGMQALFRKCLWQGAIAVGVIAIALFAMQPVWSQFAASLLKIPAPLAQQMWLLCVLLLGYLHVAGCGSIVAAAFYALGDTKTPMIMSVISFLGGVALKSVAFLTLDLPGLAIATSVYYVFNLIALCTLFKRRIHVDVS